MRTVFTGLALCLATVTGAQAPQVSAAQSANPISQQAAALSRLDFMLGTWTGSGWMMLGPGRRAEFTQTEIVTRKLDGALLTIDGDGRDAANPDRHIHSAFATLSYLPESSAFRFIPFSGGHMLDVTPTLGDHTLVWGFDAPYGKTRYTLDFSTGQWHETGEVSRDNGQTWTKNFEMTLSRKS